MAYEAIGTIYKIGETESIPTKSGNVFTKRSLTLQQKRYDPSTGQEYEPNYPSFEFTQNRCSELDNYMQGDMVKVKFDIVGVKYNKNGEEDFFSRLRAFGIEYFTTAPQVKVASVTNDMPF